MRFSETQGETITSFTSALPFTFPLPLFSLSTCVKDFLKEVEL